MSSRFDPLPNEPYGVCTDCGIELRTKDRADEHMSNSSAHIIGSKSHTVRVTNPDRAARILDQIRSEILDALSDAEDRIQDLVHDDEITLDEARSAVNRASVEASDEIRIV